MTGLYIHVPFCAKKCHYCNFVIAPAAPAENRRVFLEALEKEARRCEHVFSDTVFDTVYIGGGTPSVLEADELERLFHILRGHFRWNSDAEVTCEANPGDVGLSKAMRMKKLGVNRVSLGAQSFHDDTLARLNRAHNAAQIESSFRHLRDAGFDNISLDLILSLPGEGWERVRGSLEKLIRLDPEHVSVYELTVEDKTVFGELQKQGRLGLPGEEEQVEILSNTRLFLKNNGWRHYELLSYAKRGYESRHNLLYWANENTLGLGPGAYSYIQGRRYRLSDSYRQYLEKTASGDWSATEDETLSAERREIESFVLALRLTDGTSLGRFPGAARTLAGELAGLQEKGLLDREEDRVNLSAKGQLFAETVFSQLSAC